MVTLAADDRCISVADAVAAPLTVTASADSLKTSSLQEEIVAILFGDALNFSALNEAQLPLFLEHFVGLVATVRDSSGIQPLSQNTWGDGLYLVYKTVGDAGRVALQLSDSISGMNWATKGLPTDMNIRIGLHAGPTFACVDPITARPNYMGAHVSRAARFEPITPPGQVYASEAFAALVAATRVREFECEYVGLRPLAKGYGTFGTYHLRHRRNQ